MSNVPVEATSDALARLLASSAKKSYYVTLAWEPRADANAQEIDEAIIAAIESYPYVRPLSRVAFLIVPDRSAVPAIRSVLEYIAGKLFPDSIVYLLSPALAANDKWAGRISAWSTLNFVTTRPESAPASLPPGELTRQRIDARRT